MVYLGLIAVLVLGVLMFCRPEWLWKLEHLFSVKGGEPTDFYLAKMRIAGVIFVLIAVFIAVQYVF